MAPITLEDGTSSPPPRRQPPLCKGAMLWAFADKHAERASARMRGLQALL